jgi:hypothetical protein
MSPAASHEEEVMLARDLGGPTAAATRSQIAPGSLRRQRLERGGVSGAIAR